ncbi:hypothetical protein CKO42_22205 [Lamprobacter modestohalophilus]|uniref:DUF2281 domain-containing protein n=1 Tax=Lamprobacter modestohalophilus TaxID=1064514 RepID=A0A9X0WCK1_9GAMM|nr:DUF2281 domain-containing protein [Lamprobacter modestohalophilus]MBK1621085.1 hypothetical protein [Lamprobacter modestohalophilus]
MIHAELIETLERLPQEKQAEVLDFARFLAQRRQDDNDEPKPLGECSFAKWVNTPLVVNDFQPMSREDANAR